ISVKTQERSGVITIGSSAASTVNAWPTGGAGWRKASASTATQAAGSEKMISATAAVANTLRLKPRVRSHERPKASNALQLFQHHHLGRQRVTAGHEHE